MTDSNTAATAAAITPATPEEASENAIAAAHASLNTALSNAETLHAKRGSLSKEVIAEFSEAKAKIEAFIKSILQKI